MLFLFLNVLMVEIKVLKLVILSFINWFLFNLVFGNVRDIFFCDLISWSFGVWFLKFISVIVVLLVVWVKLMFVIVVVMVDVFCLVLGLINKGFWVFIGEINMVNENIVVIVKVS